VSVKGPRITDGVLVQRAADGDAEAFDALVLRHQDRVFSLVCRLVGCPHEAEDVTQEAFLRAHRALGSFRQGAAFSTWLYRIAVNCCHSQGRKAKRRQQVEGVRLSGNAQDDDQTPAHLEPVDDGALPHELLAKTEAQQRLHQELARLSEDYRTILLLRDFDGLDYAAIAEVLGISRAAVKSRLHRARVELASRLDDLKDEAH
jgi:RNA polymerase sigma-70 factor (ECF subfamily)